MVLISLHLSSETTLKLILMRSLNTNMDLSIFEALFIMIVFVNNVNQPDFSDFDMMEGTWYWRAQTQHH